MQPTLAVKVTVAVLFVELVKTNGAIVVVLIPAPLVRLNPCTLVALSSSHVTVYPGTVEVTMIGKNAVPEQISWVSGMARTLPVGLISTVCMTESIPQPFPV